MIGKKIRQVFVKSSHKSSQKFKIKKCPLKSSLKFRLSHLPEKNLNLFNFVVQPILFYVIKYLKLQN
jgi:hypothetical protein